MYDIIFISYNEPNADKNYHLLSERFPIAKRVHSVTGIHQAHIAAAKKALTKMFWVVDGDAKIEDTFDFSFTVSKWDESTVYTWLSRNPVNGLTYGYGGVKLLPKSLTLSMDLDKPDVTTSISENFKLMPEIANTTEFNTDPFSTWRSAFRECAKLASKTIDRQIDSETDERLSTWTTVGRDAPFGNYAIKGAIAGMNYGIDSNNNMLLINDFNWLKSQFEAMG
jgi:hypothetical protein